MNFYQNNILKHQRVGDTQRDLGTDKTLRAAKFHRFFRRAEISALKIQLSGLNTTE